MFLLSSHPDDKVLPGDLTHYVVPDVGVVVDYLEILEFSELQGIVFTQTACQAIQHSKGRRYCAPTSTRHNASHLRCIHRVITSAERTLFPAARWRHSQNVVR